MYFPFLLASGVSLTSRQLLSYPQKIPRLENKKLRVDIGRIFYKSRRSYGSQKIQQAFLREENKNVVLKRVTSIMRKHDLKSKVRRKYKATTNSSHHLPIADNILNRSFKTTEPKQKLVSDITYLPTRGGFILRL